MNRHERRSESRRRVETMRAVQAAQRKRHAGVLIAGRWHPIAPEACAVKEQPRSEPES